MTGNKRFTPYKNNDRIVGFKDNITGKHHCSIIEARWLLNHFWEKTQRLTEENKELKEERKGFESCSHNWGLLYDEAKNKVEELSKENKELKDKNSQLQETLAFRSNQLALMEQLIDDLGSEEMDRQMEEILND